jgi:hypothetical protein
MGHVRLGELRKTRAWNQVIELLASSSDVDGLSAEIADAAEKDLLSVLPP